MNKRDHKILRRDKRNLEKRIERKQFKDQPKPMFKGGNIFFQMSERIRAIGCGGIGAMHMLVRKLKLDRRINDSLALLKYHLPYHESDHVLNIAYNVISGGKGLEDIELLRNDETYMNALGAKRIPDPTTAGDFLRRFDAGSIVTLQETFNETRQKLWARQAESFRKEAVIDIDGTIAGTKGECKEGMDISYKGIWGYAPLILSLANTDEVLYIVNRPGSRPSSDGAAPWIDRSISLASATFQKISLRGDTDFSLTENFDRWDEEKVRFVFGYDAHANLVKMAENLPEGRWMRLERPRRYEVKTEERRRPENVKEQVVKEREFENIRLQSEDVAEFDYRPGACQKTYRMVVVRKNLTIEKGERQLFDDIRYLFYITNDRETIAAELVFFANERCDQENVIAQLKGGVNAFRIPSDGLESNWAYMVIAALAWNLKAWYGLVTQQPPVRADILRMEFKRFVSSFIQIPCQIVNTGRRLVYRILAYKGSLTCFLETFDYIRRLRFV